MKRFYDAHCHMMNLSHPDLSAMAQRAYRESGAKRMFKIRLAAFLFAVLGMNIAKRLAGIGKYDDRAMNLLAIMETEMGDYLLQMEEDLRNNLKWGGGAVLSEGGQSIHYDRIFLTPLIMDFGLKEYHATGTIYKVRWKPIVSQVMDVCLGIKHYYQHCDRSAVAPLFQIHPFMGLNTKNYDLDSSPDGTVGLRELLCTYFAGFENDTPVSRFEKISAHDWRNFEGNIRTIGPYSFIGIKLYPPLGFNPWPTGEPKAAKEMEKVRELYSFCQGHNIPITVHCSEGGFLVDKKFEEFANPDKWRQVLEAYPKLRLNLAHFGARNAKWREAIADLILNHDHVFTDVSYRGVKSNYYAETLKAFVDGKAHDEREKLLSRIIFGSDFMINLMEIDSYSHYMRIFAETPALSLAQKNMLCSTNPESFLFMGYRQGIHASAQQGASRTAQIN